MQQVNALAGERSEFNQLFRASETERANELEQFAIVVVVVEVEVEVGEALPVAQDASTELASGCSAPTRVAKSSRARVQSPRTRPSCIRTRSKVLR